jgi:predicted transglutaminase-like cysteine proteinase
VSLAGQGIDVSNTTLRVFLLTAISFGGLHAAKTEVLLDPPRATFAAVGEITSSPYGWMDFCIREPQECNQPALIAADVNLTPLAWKTVTEVNQQVNAAIEPVSNLDHWGTIADHWDYPYDGKGDCKIYALQKRKILMEKGFPRQALLMTIVRDHDNQGHAILTIKTNRGDFILDNLTDEIRAWEETGYRFVKRQSQEDPNVWVSIKESKASHQASLRFLSGPTD